MTTLDCAAVHVIISYCIHLLLYRLSSNFLRYCEGIKKWIIDIRKQTQIRRSRLLFSYSITLRSNTRGNPEPFPDHSFICEIMRQTNMLSACDYHRPFRR